MIGDGIGDDGKQAEGGLYTNNSAVLYPVDSNGGQGVPENFYKPTVSYTYTLPEEAAEAVRRRRSRSSKKKIISPISSDTLRIIRQGKRPQTKADGRFVRRIRSTGRKRLLISSVLLTDDSRAEIWSDRLIAIPMRLPANGLIMQSSTMSAGNIVNGYPDGTFGPDKTITRALSSRRLLRASIPRSIPVKISSATSPDTGPQNISIAPQKRAGLPGSYPHGTFPSAINISPVRRR